MEFELHQIGRVESELTDLESAPKQAHEDAPRAAVVFDPKVHDALEGLEAGDRILIVTWLDRAERDVLQVHPRDDESNPLTGVFATRSADRPNPVGIHEVIVTGIDDGRIEVDGLEAVDGTPVVDVKPAIRASRYRFVNSPSEGAP